MSNPKPNDDKRNYEDPDDVNQKEDTKEYIPYGYDWEHNNAADLAHDAQGPEEEPEEEDLEDPGSDLGIYELDDEEWSSDDTQEGVTEEEVMSAPTPLPRPIHPCCQDGRAPGGRQTARKNVGPVTARYLFGYDPTPQWGMTGHYEIGGSSQAPPPPGRFLPPIVRGPAPPPRVVPTPTLEEHTQLVREVAGLQGHRVTDSAALQTLYCHVGAERAHSTAGDAHTRELEFRLEVAEREIRASARECLQLREQLAELVRYVRKCLD